MLINCLNRFKLTHQICCEIMIVSVIHMLITLGLIAISIALVFFFVYKDTVSHLDSQEFAEMTYLGNLFENSQLIMESSYQDYASLLAIMYKAIAIKKIKSIQETSKLKVVNTQTANPELTIIYCQSNIINDTTKEILIDMSIYLSQIKNQKIFGYKDGNNQYYNQILFIDVKNQYICAYPGDSSDLNPTIDFGDIKEYVRERISSNVQFITSLSHVFPNNLIFQNLSELPIYEESIPFPNLFKKKDAIKILSLAIVRDDYNNNPLQLDFSKVFFVIGKETSINIIYDSIIEMTNEIQILKTNYIFPYELTNKELCFYIMNLNINDKENGFSQVYQSDLNQIQNLHDCFSTQTIEAYKLLKGYETMTFKDLFFYSMNLFDNPNYSTLPNINSTQAIQLYETQLLQNNHTAFNQTINRRLLINDKTYKIRKAYLPFSVSLLINYYYPISNLYLSLIFKNENSINNISFYIRTSMIATLINCIIWSYIVMAIILVFIGIKLNKVTTSIQRILDQISNLISGKPCKESKDKDIHEFNVLIEIIDQMIKGDLDLKQTQNQKEERMFQFDIERFHKEFQFVNSKIVVKEDSILELIENKNENLAIINKSISKMKSDHSYIKDSDIFKGIVSKMTNMNNSSINIDETIKQENDDNSINAFLSSSQSLQYDANALYKEGMEMIKEIEESCLFSK